MFFLSTHLSHPTPTDFKCQQVFGPPDEGIIGDWLLRLLFWFTRTSEENSVGTTSWFWFQAYSEQGPCMSHSCLDIILVKLPFFPSLSHSKNSIPKAG